MSTAALDGVGSLQEQVRRTILQDIADSELAPGAKLPTEKHYVDRLGVSLVTVRGALAALVQAGKIERSSGRGTFVCEPRVPYQIKLMSGTTATLRAAGVPFDLQVVYAAPGTPPDDVRTILQLRRGARAFRLQRLASIRGIPAILLDSWLHRSATAAFERDATLLENSSLYTRFREHGIRLAQAEGRVDLVYATDEQATLMHLPFGAPLFAYTSTARDETGSTIERAVALYDANRFSLTVSPDVGI